MSKSDPRDGWPASALQAADKAFAALTVDPAPLTLDCAALAAAGMAASGTTGGGIAAFDNAESCIAEPGTAVSGDVESGSAAADGGTAAGTSGAGGGTAAATPARSGIDLDLPEGDVPLPALRDWLMAHPSAYTARDTVWRELIRRARQGKPEWVIAAVGMAMPALVAMAGALAAGYHGDPADIDAEILTGFLEGLRRGVDPAQDAPHASLCFTAWRAGWDLRLAQRDLLPVNDIEHAAAESRLPRHPYGHVDLLVYRAAALGLIDSEDVEPYIEIRLGGRTPQLVAEQARIEFEMLRMRLIRADARIAQALSDGTLTGTCSPDARKQLARSQDIRAKIRAGKARARRTAGARPRVRAAAAAS